MIRPATTTALLVIVLSFLTGEFAVGQEQAGPQLFLSKNLAFMPTSASASAMAEKTPNNMENRRWLRYCASRSMVH